MTQSSPRICVIDRTDGVRSPELDRYAAVHHVQTLRPDTARSIDPGTEVVFVRAGYWNAIDALLEDAPALRWVHINMAGVDHIVTPALRASDVVLTNARGVLDEAIAEFVQGAVLLWSKGLLTSVLDTRERRTNYRTLKGNDELAAVVIGAGSIGTAIARKLRAMGVPWVDGVRRTVGAASGEFDRVLTVDELRGTLGEYSVVVAVLPATETTRGLLGEELLSALAEETVFVNVGRGDTVDNVALAAAIEARPGSAAILDVTSPEPLPPEHPLFERRNVVISPHMSGDTHSRHARFTELFLGNLERFRRGERLRNVVDTAEH